MLSNLDFLIGNGIGWLLKNKYAGFSNKAIPIALVVWNTLYHALKVVSPESVPDLQGASLLNADMVYQHVGWFSDLGGIFKSVALVGGDAMLDTAKQMAVHSVAKNSWGQGLAPVLSSFLSQKFPTRRKR